MTREDEENIVPLGAAAASAHGLPYKVELWDLLREGPERVVGRAASMVLARAIFAAAQSEHLGRKIVLRRDAKILAKTD